MKLIVKIVDAAGVPGGRALMLCDENGTPLPNQITTSLQQRGPGEPAHLVVGFLIDGKGIAFDDSKGVAAPSPFFEVLPGEQDGGQDD